MIVTSLLIVLGCGWIGAPPESPRTLLTIEPSKEYPRNSEGDFITLKDGRLCLVYTRFRGGRADDAAADIVARDSTDGGKTWSADRMLVENEGRRNVMSVSLLRPRGGGLLLFYLRKHDWNDLSLLVRRSDDELKTLSEPIVATPAPGYHVVNNARVVQLRSGRLLVPAALHAAPGGKPTFPRHGILRAFLSDDEGRTWRADRTELTPPEAGSPALQEPGLVELKDGRVLMYARTDAGSQFQSISTDGGESWTKPEPGPLASPLSPATIVREPWSGDLLCVWNDHSGWHVFPPGKRAPLCIARSRDEGRTWGPSRVLEGNLEGWYCYTAARFIGDELLLGYCATKALDTLKVMALPRAWLEKSYEP